MTRAGTPSSLPHRSYVSRRWPTSLLSVPHQLSPIWRRLSLMEAMKWAGLSSSGCLRASGIPFEAVVQLCQWHDRRNHANPYHNKAHTAQVICAAGLLADKAGIGRQERDVLLVAALIHDFKHLGRWRSRAAYWQEQASLTQAFALLMKGGIDRRLLPKLTDMVLATSPVHDRTLSPRSDDSAALLLDADLFASLFLPEPLVRRLTATVKFEDRLPLSLEDMLSYFLDKCRAHGFASHAGASLYAALPPAQRVL